MSWRERFWSAGASTFHPIYRTMGPKRGRAQTDPGLRSSVVTFTALARSDSAFPVRVLVSESALRCMPMTGIGPVPLRSHFREPVLAVACSAEHAHQDGEPQIRTQAQENESPFHVCHLPSGEHHETRTPAPRAFGVSADHSIETGPRMARTKITFCRRMHPLS